MNDKKPLTPSELGKLYPHAKTYDELQADREEASRFREQRKPKFITLRASFLLTIICSAILFSVWCTPRLFAINAMLGAIFVIGGLLLLTWYGKWAVTRIIDLYDLHGKNPKVFLVTYVVLIGIFVGLIEAIGWGSILNNLASLGTIAIIHFVLTALLARSVRDIGAIY